MAPCAKKQETANLHVMEEEMMAVIQSAIPRDDYSLEIVMTNSNRLLCYMEPYLDTIQYCPLRDRKIWEHIEIMDTSLRFLNSPNVEISLDMLLDLVQKDKDKGGYSMIDKASINQEGVLQVILKNTNRIEMDLGHLIQYPLFTLLIHEELLKTMKVKPHSLLWEKDGVTLEIAIQTVLNYFQ